MSETQSPTLSVVMPAHNEEGAIEDAIRDLQEYVFTVVPESEAIIVDDGSRDRTGEILDRLAESDSRLRVIHQAQGGHGRALRTGMDAARGEYLFLLDSDRQIPLDAFGSLWGAAQGRDGVFGVRAARNDPKVRLLLSRFIRLAIALFFKVRLKDPNVPFKVLRRQIWLDARELIPRDTLAPSLFLAIHTRHRGHEIIELDVRHRERETGAASLRHWKLLKFCLRAFRQLLQFRRALASEGRPRGRAEARLGGTRPKSPYLPDPEAGASAGDPQCTPFGDPGAAREAATDPAPRAGLLGRALRNLNEFWAPPAVDSPTSSVPTATLAGLLFLLLFARNPNTLLSPHFWAEDGAVFFKDQLELGFFGAALKPLAGYTHLAPRVVAGLASLFPWRFAPLIYAVSALAVASLIGAWFSRKEYRHVVPNDWLRAAICIGVACAPTGTEILGSIANLQWYLFWLGYLLLIAPLPRSNSGRITTLATWFLIGLTAPGVAAFLPVWLLRIWIRRDLRERMFSLACLVPILYGASLVRTLPVGIVSEPVPAIWALLRGTAGLFCWRVATEALFGESGLVELAGRLKSLLPLLSICGLVACSLILCRRGTAKQKTWLILSAVILWLMLNVIVMGRPEMVVQVALYRTGWGGGRYFYAPVCILIVLFFASLGAARGWLRALVAPFVFAVAVSSSLLFRVPQSENLNWRGYAAALEQARESGATEVVTFPVNPAWWPERVVRIRFVEGRPTPSDDSH